MQMIQRSSQSKRRIGYAQRPYSLLSALFAILLVTLFFTLPTTAKTADWDQMTQTCRDKLFPIVSGGSKAEEVACTLNDPEREYIIVGGNTTSSDYAPAANEHAFIYAVDYDGNWVWGKFFYNESYAISTINGCQLDDNGNLIVTGISDQYPVILEISLDDGSVESFASLALIDTDPANPPRYSIQGGGYHEVNDPIDGNSYFYTAFTADEYLMFVKILKKGKEMDVVWSFQHQVKQSKADFDNGEVNFPNFKVPGFLHQDPNNRQKMFLIGQFNYKGSVIKFSKRNMNIDWKVEIGHPDNTQMQDGVPVTTHSLMHEITSFVQPKNSNKIYGCGYYKVDPLMTEKADIVTRASMVKINDDGQLQYLYTFDTDPTFAENDGKLSDQCRAITFDYKRDEIVLMIEAKTPQFRPSYDRYKQYSMNSNDIAIVTMKESGSIVSSYNINFDDSGISMRIGTNSAFVLGNYYVFGGHSWGFKTLYQNVTFPIDNPMYDSYLFKYDPRDGPTCMYQDSISTSNLKNYINKYTNERSNDDTYDWYSKTRPYGLFKKMNNYFNSYGAQYNGHFDLQKSFKMPRMCAQHSKNLTDGLQYYRGAQEKAFIVGQQSSYGGIVASMDKGQTWIFQNGTLASGKIGRFSRTDNGGTFYVQTDDESIEGKAYKTILRGCSRFNELLELYLRVDIKTNTPPEFETDMETSWSMNVGEVIEYKLPKVRDAQGNDDSEIVVKPMVNSEFPPFVFFNNLTNTLIFRPESPWYTGQKYYFRVVTREKNSINIQYENFCSVKILGERKTKETYINYTDYTIDIGGEIDRHSKGHIKFSNPVNFEFVKQNFDKMFDTWIQNVTYKFHKTNTDMKRQLEFHAENATTGILNFTATFRKPYLLGLLVKKRDKVFFKFKNDLLNQTGQWKDEEYFKDFFLPGVNRSEARVFPNECVKIRPPKTDGSDPAPLPANNTCQKEIKQHAVIELQFDFRDDIMFYMRDLAIKTYWYLCGIIWFQFFVLFFREVGFLPLWTLVEYMQLIAFIPLYNFRLIPYLYDAFKPFLVAHLVLTNETFVFTEMQDDYFNQNYDYYWLNTGKLGQALVLWICMGVALIMLNIVVGIVYCAAPKNTRFGKKMSNMISQFKFNAYIRYYMLSYFDLVFFSIMKLVEADDSTEMRRYATIASYVIFVLAIVIPVFLMTLVCSRFQVLKIKEAKASFNTLVLKIDKQSRWRLVQAGYFFFRRLLTAMLLSIPLNSPFIFLQYVFILMSSHIYVLYLVAMKPYQSAMLNNYVISNETFYSALIIAVFIFSDSTPELNIKLGAGVVLISSIFLLIAANLLMIIAMLYMGKQKLKNQINMAKMKRAEKELMEEEEEEERTLRQKRQEEDFVKLHDEVTNLGQYDMNDINSAMKGKGGFTPETPGMLMDHDKPQKKKKKKRKNKEKNNNDELAEYSMGGMNTTGTNLMTDQPLYVSTEKPHKKKKKRKLKNKNKQDDVKDVYIQDPQDEKDAKTDSDKDNKRTQGSSAEQSESSSDKKKKKKSKQSSN